MMLGLVRGLDNGVIASGTFATCNTKMDMRYVDGDPMTFSPPVISFTGSDLLYDISTGSFMIGDIVNGAGGSVWKALKTI